MTGLGYLCFGVIAFLFFFYMTFPFRLIQEKVMQAFENKTGCQTNVGDLKQSFPLQLTWEQIQVICPEFSPFVVESLQAKVALKPLLLHQRAEITFQVQMAGENGQIRGTVITHSTPEGLSFSLQQKGWGLNLASIGYAGILSMKGEGNWTGNDFLAGVGSLSVQLNGFRIDPQGNSENRGWTATLAGITPLLGVSSLSFPRIEGEITWQNKTMTLNKLNADGEIADLISDSGSLILNEPVSESLIRSHLQISPKGNLEKMLPLLVPNYSNKKPLTLAITGRIASPEIVMNGMPTPAIF